MKKMKNLKWKWLFNLILGGLFLFFNSIDNAAAATKWYVAIDGIVTGEEGQRLEGSVVTLRKNRLKIEDATTHASGKFIFILEPDNDYEVEASKEGYVSKKVIFSTKNVTEERGKRSFSSFLMEISIFKKRKGLNTSVLEKPIGIIHYLEKENDFAVDKKYEKSISAQLEKLYRQLEAIRKKEAEKKALRQELLAKSLKTAKENRSGVSSEKLMERNETANAASVVTNKNIPPPIAIGVIRINKLYPEGKTTNHSSSYSEFSGAERKNFNDVVAEGDNKTVITRTVIKNGQVFEYRKVIHKWGAVFFFKNGVPITENLFENEQ